VSMEEGVVRGLMTGTYRWFLENGWTDHSMPWLGGSCTPRLRTVVEAWYPGARWVRMAIGRRACVASSSHPGRTAASFPPSTEQCPPWLTSPGFGLGPPQQSRSIHLIRNEPRGRLYRWLVDTQSTPLFLFSLAFPRQKTPFWLYKKPNLKKVSKQLTKPVKRCSVELPWCATRWIVAGKEARRKVYLKPPPPAEALTRLTFFLPDPSCSPGGENPG